MTNTNTNTNLTAKETERITTKERTHTFMVRCKWSGSGNVVGAVVRLCERGNANFALVYAVVVVLLLFFLLLQLYLLGEIKSAVSIVLSANCRRCKKGECIDSKWRGIGVYYFLYFIYFFRNYFYYHMYAHILFFFLFLCCSFFCSTASVVFYYSHQILLVFKRAAAEQCLLPAARKAKAAQLERVAARLLAAWHGCCLHFYKYCYCYCCIYCCCFCCFGCSYFSYFSRCCCLLLSIVS